MNVTEAQIQKIISEAKFDFFNSDKLFDEVLYEAIQKLREAHVKGTVQKAAEYGEKFGSLDQR